MLPIYMGCIDVLTRVYCLSDSELVTSFKVSVDIGNVHEHRPAILREPGLGPCDCFSTVEPRTSDLNNDLKGLYAPLASRLELRLSSCSWSEVHAIALR